MAKEGFGWANVFTIVASIGGSILANYYGAAWALDAKMYEQAMIGANDPKTPLAMRVYYLRIIGKWQGEPLTPAQQKEIADSFAVTPDATLESLAPTNPTINSLVHGMKATSFWDNIFDVNKDYVYFRPRYDVPPSQQPPASGGRGTKVDRAPKVDRLPADGKGGQIELQKQN